MEEDSRQTTWCSTGTEQIIHTLSSENYLISLQLL